MHKIKDILSKDSDDKDTKSKEQRKDKDVHKSDKSKDVHKHKDTSKPEHVYRETPLRTEHTVAHHKTEREVSPKHIHAHEHGEKRVVHQRETVRGDLYQTGVDPSMNREVVQEVRMDEGVTRELIGEAEVVKETIKEVELHKIQPVIHREREQKEIRHIVEPIQKFEVKDTHIEHREKEIDLGTRHVASTLETSRSLGTAPTIESSREFVGTERQHQELPTRVEEHVHRKIEEHVHPVIYKEVLKPRVTEEVHHLYETVKESPIETYVVKEVHTHGTGTTREAERAFFEQEMHRGIEVGEGHHLHKDFKKEHKLKDKSYKDKDKKHKHKYEHEHTTMRSMPLGTATTTMMPQEPLVGHHQNIGAHHLAAGAVPAGHNVAYDAALGQAQPGMTRQPMAGHSDKDAGLIHRMHDLKLSQEQKMAKSEQGHIHKKRSDVV